MPRLRKHYDEVVKPELIEQFGYKNVMEVPKIDKIVLNMGVGEATQDKKMVNVAACRNGNDRRSEAGYHQGRKVDRPVQAPREHADRSKVTLRRTRMYEFLDRLITVALPRVRDFRGLNPKLSTAVATMPWA